VAELRVMTWNVQNLFAPGVEGDGPDTTAAYLAKLASLAAVIDQARPDVLALREVGPLDALTPLQATLNWQMPHIALGIPDGRGIRVAFLSTRVLRDVIDVRIFPAGLLPVQVGDDLPGPDGPATMNQMGRGALEVTIRAGGRDVTVINCHLKSKLLNYPDGRFSPRDENEPARFAAYALFRRTSEAATLRHHITERLDDRGQQYPFVLAGDLNDEPTRQPPKSSTVHPVPRSAPPDSHDPTPETAPAYGTSPRCCRPTPTPVSTADAARSSTTSLPATPSSTTTHPPSPRCTRSASRCRRSTTTPPPCAISPAPTTPPCSPH
jgi:endonuclease/exonuclease/phosphatase family metal-dependent hydrolase